MGKKVNAFVLFTALTSSVFAQSLRKTEKIDQTQVPVAIQVAFEQDFGGIPSAGYWTANFIVEREGNRSVAKPLFYTYHQRNKVAKIEIRYTADGKLEYAKGMDKKMSSS